MTSCTITTHNKPIHTSVSPETGRKEKLGKHARLNTTHPLKQAARTEDQQKKLDNCLSNIIKSNLGQLHGKTQDAGHSASGHNHRSDRTGHDHAAGKGSRSHHHGGHHGLTGQGRGQTAGAEQGRAHGHQHDNHTHMKGNGHIKHHCDGDDTTPATGGGLPDTGIITDGGDLTLEIQGLLQGAFNPATGLMNDKLREQGLLPTTNGSATASAATLATTGNDAPVDWVTIELRDRNNPNLIISSQTALIQRDGDVANPDTNSSTLHFSDVPAGDYFVTLSHRNHLDVMTTVPVNLSANSTLIDFTNPATLAGNQMTVNDKGEAMLWAGDANGNNNVIADGPDNDLNAILTTVLTSPDNPEMDLSAAVSGYRNSDVNLDGQTVFNGDNSDASLVSSNASQQSDNSSGSANFVLNGSVPPGATGSPKTTVTQPDQALLDSLWF